jgi:hypothetical protein
MSEAHAAFRAECHIRLPGGVLVLAPPGAFGLGAVSVASVADGPGRLRLMAGHAEAFARLRADWVGLGLPGLPGRLSDTELLALLESAIASRRLAVAFFPRPVDPLDRLAADTIPRQPAPAAPVAAKSVRDMSRSERVEAALKRVPAHLTGELKNAFLGLISPTSIGITVAAFAGLAVAQFFGYGEAADAVLAAIAYGIAGLSGVRALYDMVAATVSAATATNDAEIDAAALRLANAFVVLGMAFLTIFVTRAARKAAQSRAAANAPVPKDTPPARSAGRSTDQPQRALGPPKDETVPATPADQAANLSGHGNGRHGSQTTVSQQTTRVQTGVAPDGALAPTPRATRFDSPEAELDAVSRAQSGTAGRIADGTTRDAITVGPDGVARLPRDSSVVTGYPGGYGSGVEVMRDPVTNAPLPGRPVVPTGQDPNALVVLQKDPATGVWEPITQYPTNKPPSP